MCIFNKGNLQQTLLFYLFSNIRKGNTLQARTSTITTTTIKIEM